MKAFEHLERVKKSLYCCGSCGVTMFGGSIPGGTVIARLGREGLLEFTCPNCSDGILEPIVSNVPPRSWRSA